jgi:hypothetical protein
MPLTMRPTGLGAGIDKDRPDYTVYSGRWAVGWIYETRGGPDHLRWFWSMTVTCPMTRSDVWPHRWRGRQSPVSEGRRHYFSFRRSAASACLRAIASPMTRSKASQYSRW